MQNSGSKSFDLGLTILISYNFKFLFNLDTDYIAQVAGQKKPGRCLGNVGDKADTRQIDELKSLPFLGEGTHPLVVWIFALVPLNPPGWSG